ncbi:MAG: hypothetical protein KDA89_25475 [Planctomycetaceae bacterium]|nr:hypothetical protein [Planctomycetaceae bacterium]
MNIQNVEGYIIPKYSTRLRTSYSTYSDSIGTYPTGTKVYISQVIERTETDSLKVNDFKGDKWGKVIKINDVAISGEAYMAIVYHNSAFQLYPICDEYYSVVEEVPPVDETPVAEVKPDFILVYVQDAETGDKVEVTYKEDSSKVV